MALEIDVLTLFPTMFDGPLAASIPGRIQERGLATVRVHDLRDWGLGRHRTVDDTTYGGGAGMVLRPEPVAAAFAALRRAGHAVDPARPDGRRVPPVAGRRAGRPRAPSPAVRPLRGRRRADPLDGRSRAVDRGLRPDRRRAGGAGRDRFGHPAAAGCHRRSVHRRGVIHPRPPRVSAVHASAVVRWRRGSRRSSSPATTAPCAAGASRSRCAGRWSAGPTCSSTGRRAPRSGACSTSSPRRGTGRPAATRTRAILRRRSPPRPPSDAYPAVSAAHASQEPQRERARRDRQGPASNRPAGDRHRRHRQGLGAGRRRQPRAHPGLRGHRDAPARRRHHPHDHGPPDRVAGSASSARSRSTARASTRSRSSATASPAAPSCTSCASASARRPPSASAARNS